MPNHPLEIGRGARRLQIGLGLAGLAPAAVSVPAALQSVHVRLTAARPPLFEGVRVTASGALLLAVAAVGAAVLGVVAREAWRHWRAHRRFVRDLPVVAGLGAPHGVVVIADRRSLAFCAGWLRPRVYVSTGALGLLSADELHAVLAHERHHRRMRDPLHLAGGQALSRALFFLPILRAVHERYGELAECAADAAAVRASDGDPSALASAMLVFGAHVPGQVTGISPGRIDRLLGRGGPASLPSLVVALALTTIAALSAVLWLLAVPALRVL